jgi:hypothetical protein
MCDLYMSNGTLSIVAAESGRGSWPSFDNLLALVCLDTTLPKISWLANPPNGT